MTDDPKPLWITTEEGGDFIPWSEWTVGWDDPRDRWTMAGGKTQFRCHSIGFDNMRVFDPVGGWRDWSTEGMPHEMLVRMGLAKHVDPIADAVAELRRTNERAQQLAQQISEILCGGARNPGRTTQTDPGCLDQIVDENERLRTENAGLRKALDKAQYPQGQQESLVIEWLRGRGWQVERLPK